MIFIFNQGMQQKYMYCKNKCGNSFNRYGNNKKCGNNDKCGYNKKYGDSNNCGNNNNCGNTNKCGNKQAVVTTINVVRT